MAPLNNLFYALGMIGLFSEHALVAAIDDISGDRESCTTTGVCYVAVEHENKLDDFDASQRCSILRYTGLDGKVHTDYEYAMLETIDENNAASVATKDLECKKGRGVMFGKSTTSDFTNYAYGQEDQTKDCLTFYNEELTIKNQRGKWASTHCSSDNVCYACMRREPPKEPPSSGSTSSGSTSSGSTSSGSTSSGSTSSGSTSSGSTRSGSTRSRSSSSGSKSGGSKSGSRRRV